MRKQSKRDFPAGAVVKNPPSDAEDAGLIPGQVSKIPHAVGLRSPCTAEPVDTRACAHPPKGPVCHNEDPTQPKINKY